MKSVLLGLAVLTVASLPCWASVIIAGEVSTPTRPCSITLTDDLTFTKTSSENESFICLVFDEMTVGSPLANRPTIYLSTSVTVDIGGTVVQCPGSLVLQTNRTESDRTPYDAYLSVYYSPNIPVGTPITFLAGTWDFMGDSLQDASFSRTFDGNMFLTGFFGSRISNVIPEPSIALLGAAAAFGSLLPCRRRSA